MKYITNIKKTLEMKKYKYLIVLLISICTSCSHESQTEKYQTERNKIYNVASKVHEIKLGGNLLIGQYPRISLINDKLIVKEFLCNDNQLHLFNKNNYAYITSFAPRGEGPNEICRIGNIGVDEKHQKLYVSDHGKQIIYGYDVDSLIHDSLYVPFVKWKMNDIAFPSEYDFYSDTLAIGRIIQPIGSNDFKPIMAKINLKTNQFKLMPNDHPDVLRNRFVYASSLEHKIYVQCYNHCDLLTICDFDGNLKYHVYGPNWDDQSYKSIYFRHPLIVENKLMVLYYGRKHKIGECANLSEVFNLEGDYLYTINFGHEIVDLCYDKENQKLLLALNDENMQFAYVNLCDITF